MGSTAPAAALEATIHQSLAEINLPCAVLIIKTRAEDLMGVFTPTEH